MIELTIQRPNGKIEKVDWTKGEMNDKLFGMIQDATKKADKGDVISWESVDTRTDEQKSHEARRKAAGYCDKCGTYCYGDCQAN